MQHFHSEPEPQSVYTDANASPHNTGASTEALDAAEQRRLQESIEDYLDRVCRPLMDTLPYAARQELRREIAQHLNALVHAYRESGYAPALATEKALDKFGPPHLVAQKWNPVTAREGQYKRIERWFAVQWQGIAATLVLCSAAGLLGLIVHYSGTLSPHKLTPSSQPVAATEVAPATSTRALFTASAASEADFRTEMAAQLATRNLARAEYATAQTHLVEHEVALRSIMHTLTVDPAIKDILRLKRQVLEQQIVLEQQKVLAQQEAANQAANVLETLKSQIEHRGL